MHSFFQLPMSLQHPFRAELFQDRFKKGHELLNRDNLHFAPYLLTTSVDERIYNCLGPFIGSSWKLAALFYKKAFVL
ncbi:MAG: hypothetical protein RL329_3542 [Bacteroidota bacterium]|jgi:hypothetical protein